MALDQNNLYEGILAHVGHEIECVTYGDADDPENVAMECVTCGVVLLDANQIDTDSIRR